MYPLPSNIADMHTYLGDLLQGKRLLEIKSRGIVRVAICPDGDCFRLYFRKYWALGSFTTNLIIASTLASEGSRYELLSGGPPRDITRLLNKHNAFNYSYWKGMLANDL